MAHFEALVEMLDSDGEQAWSSKLFALANSHGFEQTLFAVVPNRQASLETAFLRSNYAPRWRSAYDAGKFLHFDPTVAHCVWNTLPLVWSPEIFVAPRQRDMYEEASGYGIRSGITLPIHGPEGELGMICFVTDATPGKRFMQEARHCLPDLTLLRDYALESSRRFARPLKEPDQKIRLTPRELECLKWAMIGKSSWEIAQILHCSEAAVNFHMANIRRKFAVTTRQQAVVKAIGLGLITPG
jgi:LuxR family quorum-sensing transcriptional regulator LasR